MVVLGRYGEIEKASQPRVAELAPPRHADDVHPQQPWPQQPCVLGEGIRLEHIGFFVSLRLPPNSGGY